MLNEIILMGRLTKAPELRFTQKQTAVVSFSIACDRDFSNTADKQTDFINVVAWRNTAEFINKYFSKGSMIALKGRLTSRQYEDRDGKTRTAFEVVAENVYFAESKKHADVEGADYTPPANVTQQPSAFSEIADDGELPF